MPRRNSEQLKKSNESSLNVLKQSKPTNDKLEKKGLLRLCLDEARMHILFSTIGSKLRPAARRSRDFNRPNSKFHTQACLLASSVCLPSTPIGAAAVDLDINIATLLPRFVKRVITPRSKDAVMSSSDVTRQPRIFGQPIRSLL